MEHLGTQAGYGARSGQADGTPVVWLDTNSDLRLVGGNLELNHMNAAWLGAVAVAVSVEAMAQGTVLFGNSGALLGTVQPIYLSYCGPWGSCDVKLEGTAYLAQLWAGPTPESLAPIGAALPFRTGAGAGIIVNQSNERVIESVAPGAMAWVQIRAWAAAAGATWEEAVSVSCTGVGLDSGRSSVWMVRTGGGSPDQLPQPLYGFMSFSIHQPCPEPSTVALGLLGLATLGWARRR